ncbi:uncharacterized protein PgNI_12195 [Pyricularia grisea]|uniref:Ricin B lectin domain-containing protein n=1 Tax=Pyricularia grisea TaxID=148305 RepID=A0A6P8AQ87_PYRGI|nr:uncharacterized protein PgNI_12195 [Pyricularia grisea]TLD04230.1 hypothetical protein PgNI_12195 [Pyricularia grisea]
MKILSLFTVSAALAVFPAGILAVDFETTDSDCHIWVKDSDGVMNGYGKAVTGQQAIVRIDTGTETEQQWTFTTHVDKAQPKNCAAELSSGQKAFPRRWQIMIFKSDPWVTISIAGKPYRSEGYRRDPKTRPKMDHIIEIPYGKRFGTTWFVPLHSDSPKAARPGHRPNANGGAQKNERRA